MLRTLSQIPPLGESALLSDILIQKRMPFSILFNIKVTGFEYRASHAFTDSPFGGICSSLGQFDTKKDAFRHPFLYRSDRIRTCDLCVPNAALYQAEPHFVDMGFRGSCGKHRLFYQSQTICQPLNIAGGRRRKYYSLEKYSSRRARYSALNASLFPVRSSAM